MQRHHPLEDEILARYRRGARCLEIAVQLGLPVHEVVACVLRCSADDPGPLGRPSREVRGQPGSARAAAGAEDYQPEAPRHRAPDAPSVEAGLDAPDETASDMDGDDEEGDVEGPERRGWHIARGWLVTAEQFAAIFSAERGHFADVRLKQT